MPELPRMAGDAARATARAAYAATFVFYDDIHGQRRSNTSTFLCESMGILGDGRRCAGLIVAKVLRSKASEALCYRAVAGDRDA
jgi:hypothetical protein